MAFTTLSCLVLFCVGQIQVDSDLERELFPIRVPESLKEPFEAVKLPENAGELFDVVRQAEGEYDIFQSKVSAARLFLSANKKAEAEKLFKELSKVQPPLHPLQLERALVAIALDHESFAIESGEHTMNATMDYRALVVILLAVDHLQQRDPTAAKKFSDIAVISKELLLSASPQLARKIGLEKDREKPPSP